MNLDDVRAAARVIDGVAHRTPVMTSRTLGAGIHLKCESFQRGGAFKFRGAYTFLSSLGEEERERGVCAISSGNHAQAVALSARGERYRALVEQAAREYTLDSALLHAVIATESAYDPRAVSPKGAVGLMQLMPETARRYGVSDAFDPGENVRAGARYLRDLLARFDNDVALSLAAYNAGERAVIDRGYRIPPYKETLRYVPAVLARYREIKGLPDS